MCIPRWPATSVWTVYFMRSEHPLLTGHITTSRTLYEERAPLVDRSHYHEPCTLWGASAPCWQVTLPWAVYFMRRERPLLTGHITMSRVLYEERAPPVDRPHQHEPCTLWGASAPCWPATLPWAVYFMRRERPMLTGHISMSRVLYEERAPPVDRPHQHETCISIR
jgi:hypothetical protein